MYKYQLYNAQLGSITLSTDPEGWDSLEYELERHPRYHGFSTEFTLELTFYKEGYDFLHAVSELQGIEGNVTAVIWQASGTNFGWRKVYEGAVALDTAQFSEEGWAKANLEQSSFVTAFLNGEDVKVNLQRAESVRGRATAPYATGFPAVHAHSREVLQRYEAANDSAARMPGTPIELAGQRKQRIMYGFNAVALNEVGANTYTTGFAPQDVDMELFTCTVSAQWEVDAYINSYLEITQDKGTFDRVDLKIYLRKNNEEPLVLFSKNFSWGSVRVMEVMEARVQTSIPMEPGDKLYLYGQFHLTEITGNLVGQYRFTPSVQLSTDSYVKLSGATTTAATAVKSVLLHEAFARVCTAVTGRDDVFYSPLLGRVDSSPRQYEQDGEYSAIALTNGFMLRNFPLAGAEQRAVFASFSELFDAVNAIACIGAGVEEREGKLMVVVDKREKFYSDKVVLKLGKVSGLTKAAASDYYYNEAEAGYSEWSSETTNGLEEFNAKLEYTLPITKVKNKYSAVCNYIAGGYKIEETRRQQYDYNTSKDSKDDEKNFVLAVVRTAAGWETERMHSFAEVHGVSEPSTAYNLRLCPARMLQRHLAFLRPSFHKQVEAGWLRFNKGEGKYTLETRLDSESETLKSDASLRASAMPAPCYDPEAYEFTAPLTPMQIAALQEEPYGLIEFESESGLVKRGYVLRVVGSLHEKEAKFKVIKKHDSDE